MSTTSPVRRSILVCALLATLAFPLSGSPPVANAGPPVGAPTARTDEVTAMAQAQQTGTAVRVDSLTGERRDVSANPDGTYTAEVAAEPQRIRRNGDWVPIDTALIPVGSSLEPAASPTDVSVSDGGADPLVTVRDGDRSVSLTWPEPLPAPTLVDGRATYALAEGIDLAVGASTTGFSFDVIVATAEAARNPVLQRLEFGWSAHGVTLVQTDTGFEARADDGEVVFTGPRPRMWASVVAQPVTDPASVSAALDRSEDTPSVELGLRIDATHLTLSASREWLTAPQRIFPVVVDPSLDTYSEDWTMVWSDGQKFWNSSTQDHRVGYDGWSNFKKSRLFYAMSLDGLTHKHVLSATFAHSQYHSPNFRCDLGSYGPGVQLWRTGSISKSTSWSSQPDWKEKLATADLAHGNDQTCPGDSQTEWGGKDLVTAVQAASTAGQTTITFGLRSADESDRDGWRRFHRKDRRGHKMPKLVVKYNTVPSAPTSIGLQYARYYAGRWYVPDRTPLLSAVVSDADAGQHLAGRFITTINGRFSYFTSAIASSGSRVTTQWPQVPDGTYSTYAHTWDGVDWSPKSGSLAFTVDGAAPAAPTIRVVANGSPLVGQRVSVTLDSTSTDVTGYRFGVGTTTPTTPYDLTPSTLGAATTVSFGIPRSGPNIVTARAVDRAGNLSAVARIEIKASVVLPWDVYDLDGNGTDVRQSGRTATLGKADPLNVPAETSWSAGHTASASDQALDTRPSSGVRHLTSTATEIDTSQSFSLGAWVYVAPVTSQPVAVYQAVAGLTDGVSSSATLGLFQGADGTSVRASLVLDSATSSTNQRAAVTAPTALPVGQWAHLVMVYNRETATAQLYVNGALVGSRSAVPVPFRAPRLQVGQSPNDGVAQPFSGFVDSVRLYRGPADAGTVQQYYRATA